VYGTVRILRGGLGAAAILVAMTSPSDDPALEALRFPIGRWEEVTATSPAQVREDIDRLAVSAKRLRSAVAGLGPSQLATPYRPGGWTVRQVVHHTADAALHGYSRFRFALTEDAPTIHPYLEARWAELTDAREGPIEPSLAMFDGTIARWTALLRTLGPKDWERTYVHPEHGRSFRLDAALSDYAWHHEHHCAQISQLRARAGWK
jgi:hypothetical protein